MNTKRKVCFLLVVGIAFFFVLRSTSTELFPFNAVWMKLSEGAHKSMFSGSNRTPRPYLIPGDDTLEGLKEVELFEIYWTYINTIQTLCMNQSRVGSIKDGGKEVCIDESFKPRQPCIIYSFGSNNQFDFEISAAAKFKCEIHAFDPSRGERKWNIPESVKFHDIGIRGAGNVGNKGTEFKFKTLSGIMKELDHEQATIDVLKMDVEGWEWKAIPEMIGSGFLKNVKQMCIEFHFQGNKDQQLHRLKTLRQLYEHGFYIFMHDRNPVTIRNDKTPLNELSFINLN